MSFRKALFFSAPLLFSAPVHAATADRHAAPHATRPVAHVRTHTVPRNVATRNSAPRNLSPRNPAAHSPEEHISVSARRTDFAFQAAQHSPDADTRLSAETLIQRGVVTLRGLERVAPNLTVQSINGTASTNFYLRGVGFNDFTQNNMPPVVTYFDDVPFAYSTMASGLMFDLADATVTPGPVGTTHGQSTTGGEVRLRTADPTDQWHYGASQDIASYARSRSDAYVSGPIAKGLDFRLAGQTRQGGGWQTDPTTGAHLGDADSYALRGKLRWRPDSRTTILLGAHVVQDDSEVVTAVPVSRLIGKQPLPVLGHDQAEWSARPQFTDLIGRKRGLKPSEHNQFWGWDLHLDHDFGPARLTSISAFETEREGEYTDQDGTTLSQADTYRTINANAFTQELRLASAHPDSRLQWVVGAFYQRSQMQQQFFFDYTDYVPARGYMMATNFGLNQDSVSEFGHVSYRLPHDVTLFGGLLHELDNRNITGMTSRIFGRNDNRTFHGEGTAASQFAGQVGVSWQVRPNALVYYKMSKGFKPGGFTANNTQIQAQLLPFRPETVLTYETGFKSDPIPNRLRINAAAFYNDYHDQQILGTILIPDYGPLSQLTNAPKSESWGFEGTVEMHPVAHIFVTQNFGWQRGNFQNFPTVNRPKTNAYYARTHQWKAINDNFAGVDNGQPKLTLNGQAEWRQALTSRLGLDFGPDWSYRGSQAITPGGTGFYRIPPYFLLGAHVTLRPASGHWQATIYASNILNRQYAESSGQATTTYFYIPGAPRFIGGRLSCGF